ncbi:beta-1,3-galactosyltransferase 1 isoform X2 [Rhinoderma darwinii]|uniref:beta-1,3-galactosyltransferase 1 isoform X2 n=1 Tax=Rhinoderma darwinii TaxID=43563 RepID=UPI003F67FF0B
MKRTHNDSSISDEYRPPTKGIEWKSTCSNVHVSSLMTSNGSRLIRKNNGITETATEQHLINFGLKSFLQNSKMLSLN